MSKTVLITGASRGIGAGIAEKLASEQWNIAACARKPISEGNGLCAQWSEKYGVEAEYFQVDIGNSADRLKLLEQVIARFGVIDALVNNAGVAPQIRCDLLDMTEDSFDRVMNVNAKGSFFLTQAVAKHFASRKSGVIVNIGSCSATVASINRGEYCMSKAAVGMATKLFAVKMAEFGVNVYEIRPGIIATDMTTTVKDKYDKLIAAGLTLQPRWGMPGDIAKAVASLLRGDLGYSTGQVINIDGGMNIEKL